MRPETWDSFPPHPATPFDRAFGREAPLRETSFLRAVHSRQRRVPSRRIIRIKCLGCVKAAATRGLYIESPDSPGLNP